MGRRERFIEEYLVDGNGTAAAVRAGYARAGAHVTASRLLRDPKVAEAVAAGHAEKRAELKIDRQSVAAAFLAAYELASAQGNPGAMVSAAREIGRLCGLYAFEPHSMSSSPRDGRFGSMSDAELEALLG
jgi:phage terminase small subunit